MSADAAALKADVPLPLMGPVSVAAPEPPRATESCPDHPAVIEVACSSAVDGVPPSVSVTFVSSVRVRAAPVTAGVWHEPSPRRNVLDEHVPDHRP